MELLADIFDDSSYTEAARDFYEISRGSRELPGEDIERFLQQGGVTELEGPQG
jgi:hypothetical protein